MQGELRYPLSTTAERGVNGAAAKTALLQIIDGQIGARRAEIEELTRIRHILLGSGQVSRS